MLGLHAPDGFMEPSVALITGLISIVVIAGAIRAAGTELGDKQVPLAGIAAAFIFAAQMFNFPIAAGTSGHLLGGALAAILLRPWVGALVVCVVVFVQALVFADGGITALGYNVLNMAIVPSFAGWALFRLFRRMLPANSTGVVGATALASGASVVLAAGMFSLEWLFGASAPVPFDTVFGAMVSVHILIGIGEGVISGMVIGAVLAARPDLVAGADDLTHEQLRNGTKVGARTFVVGGLLVSVFLGAVVSQFATSAPDPLERLAQEQGVAAGADESWRGTLFSDYATDGIDNQTVSLAIAGSTGVAISLLVGYGLVSGSRRSRARLSG